MKRWILAAVVLAVGIWIGVSVKPAEAARGAKGQFVLHSHGGEMFLLNQKDGSVWRYDENAAPDRWVFHQNLDLI